MELDETTIPSFIQGNGSDNPKFSLEIRQLLLTALCEPGLFSVNTNPTQPSFSL
jgi:hypothetical protein